MVKGQWNRITPFPGRAIPAVNQRRYLAEPFIQAFHQGHLEVGIARGEPAREVLLQDILKKDRAHRPTIFGKVIPQLRFHDAVPASACRVTSSTSVAAESRALRRPSSSED